MKAFLNYRIDWDDFELIVKQTSQIGASTLWAAKLVWKSVTPSLMESKHPRLFEAGSNQAQEFLQACLDEAWERGLRPKGFSDHTNELSAVRYHLEDMRTLAKVKK